MGVSITAYTNIRPIPGVTHNDWNGQGFHAYNNPDFPERSGGIETGFYDFDDAVDGLSHSYGNYNIWRNELAKLAGWPLAPDEGESEKRSHAASAWAATEGPFWELINFADNEGVIGTEACAKLARDFAEYQSRADAHLDRWFKRDYDQMRKAFEAAGSQRGCLNFS